MKKGSALNGDFKISARLRERLKPVATPEPNVLMMQRRSIDIMVHLISAQADGLFISREHGQNVTEYRSFLDGFCQALSTIITKDPKLKYLGAELDIVRDKLKSFRIEKPPEPK